MAYTIDYTALAVKGLIQLGQSDPKAYEKAQILIEELKSHPKTGTDR